MSETSKQRRSRIDLTYYRSRDAQARRRGRLTLLALAIAGAWIVSAPLWDRGRSRSLRLFQQDMLASKGPLAKAHAIWDAECQACHVPFQAVNASRWSPSLRGAPHAGKESCRTCHPGPTHAATQIATEVASCAECHRDHRGRDASLVAIDDAGCVSCHLDLKNHHNPSAGPLRTATVATRFSDDTSKHPAFTPPAGVPGPDSKRIKFNHARHLAPGLTIEPKGTPFTFASLGPENRPRYGWKSGHDNDPVQLRCDSCHRLERTDRAAIGQRAPGDAMLPISYANDCRACHPLPFDPNDPTRQIAHGLPPKKVVEQLSTFYASKTIEADPKLLHRFIPVRGMPGRPSPKGLDRAKDAANAKTLAALKRFFGAAVDEQVRKARNLPMDRGGCVLCHELTATTRPLVSLNDADTLDIKPVVIRSLWFEGARFNHATHGALNCNACHVGAAESNSQEKLLLPDASQCVICHAPASDEAGKPRGGAGTACIECHRYHNADHPNEGIGAPTRRGKAEMTVEQFLDGGTRRNP